MDTATELGKQHVNGRVFLQTPTGRWLHRERVKEMADQLCERLAAFHKEHPQHVGPNTDDVRKELDWPGEVFETVVGPGGAGVPPASRQDACSTGCGGRLVRQEKWLRLATHRVSVSDGDSVLLKKVETALREGDHHPPQPAELAQQLGIAEKEARDVLVRLTQQAVAVKVEGELWFHREVIVRAAAGVRRMFAERKTFTTMDFRDMLGTSRKYAVPMLDYFDALGLTRRVGNTRYPGAKLATGSGPVPPAGV
jgi:selenocysteine-specific elongation factor